MPPALHGRPYAPHQYAGLVRSIPGLRFRHRPVLLLILTVMIMTAMITEGIGLAHFRFHRRFIPIDGMGLLYRRHGISGPIVLIRPNVHPTR